MTRDEFFQKLQNSAKWDVGVSIARTNPLPLDSNSIFESKDALTLYIEKNPLAYPGQVVIILNNDNTVSAAIVTSTGVDGNYIPVLSGSINATPDTTNNGGVPTNYTITEVTTNEDGKLQFTWNKITIDDGVLE